MKIEFMPFDYSTLDVDSRNYVMLLGRTSNGKKIAVIDDYIPSFWVILKDEVKKEKIEEISRKISKIEVFSASRTTRVLKTEIHDKKFLGKDVRAIQVFITNHKDAHAVADKIDFLEVDKRREYDIPMISKYIIDSKVFPLTWYEVEGELANSAEFAGINNLEIDCIRAKSIKPLKNNPEFKPKILAFDIEADEFEIGKGEILMISLSCDKFKKVLTWKNCSTSQDFVECFKNEKEMIEKFVRYVQEYGPDMLVGYFSDGFDLPYLRQRASANKIKLSLGIDNSQPSFARGRIPSAKILGTVHVDIFRFISSVYSQYLQSETLGLNEVASELLGEGKKEHEFRHSSKIKEPEWKEYFEYNMHDANITLKLAEKLWPDMIEFSRIIQEPLFDITRDSMATHVENYVLHNLLRFNEIAEKRPLNDQIIERQSREKYEGAFVFQPTPGLYENLAIFDFTSYWPSIIVSYNLSLSTFREKKEPNSIEVDIGKKVYFSKESGFFPLILKEIIEKRKKYKAEYKKDSNPITKARSNAYKLLANASYGYQGFFGARYYCPEASAATTSISRDFIKKIIDKTNSKRYKVIYGDTDGFAFLLQDNTKKDVLTFLEELNKDLPGIMELELEDFYKRGIWVTKRTGEFGAKKKYALINEQGKLKIRGFETVRRDWCTLARVLQNKILQSILNDGNEKKALELLKTTIKALQERKIDKKDIMIRTQLKKPISEYKSITPHVTAAQKMHDRNIPIGAGMLIEYFIAETREKKSLVRDKVKLPDEKGEYNIDYYLNNQIIPAVENIIEVFGINIKEIIDGNKQKKLF